METERPAWSTPKFLLIALVASFVLIFTLNAVLNVWLDLGVPAGALSAAEGVLVVALMPRWQWFRTRVLKR